MTLAPWRPALARPLHRNRARVYCRYLQLATINVYGKPSNRTVVFRGFVGEALQMVTDGRSEKVHQVQITPWAEACWYFTVTREQFRIAGKLTLLNGDNDGDSIRLKAWQALSANGRQQFYWPAPGQSKDKTIASTNSIESTEQPPDSFNVLLLVPDRVDHLALRGQPHARCIYEYTPHEWTVQEVNP
ncbi:Npun_F5749 family FMN-dependent PPOX-type flavoprotein [Leptothoe sp. PORK10 BA2]|uniref:Npun_F5749 family FMN-dependent PPOX-type flavoprotein n=1 Tax=Leptothoe sp. PORK10 BA2 TaxID=3110254 RepID=UPI002B2045D1|nr:Npun_F5749 family FMN-dependent PPOX-type flavoprotein [Leptothoe sp. PORK10 BA2]MEA5463371.1 Npun_F5749 family FMN-dependent PPOX-type flavoprotein [Leptothoe sp. PORK10 BA2]